MSAVYKNVKLIETWLEPVADAEYRRLQDLKDYTKELEFYFKDKYGNVRLTIYGSETKRISATVTYDTYFETHEITYEDGNYFLQSVSKNYRYLHKPIYKQRNKVKTEI